MAKNKKNGTDDNNSSKLYDELAGKILEQYRSKIGIFRTIFMALLISSIVFTFVILLPYVLILIDKYNKEKELYNIQNSFDYKQKENYTEAIRVIGNLNNSMTNSVKDLRNIILNINLHQIQLQIQNLSKQADLQLQNESERNIVTSVYQNLKHFSSFFTTIPTIHSILEEKCNMFDKSSNAYDVCIWKNIITNNSKYSALVDYTSLTSPLCNEKYPNYTTDLDESNSWADCILNKKFHNYIEDINNIYLNYTLYHNPHSKVQELIGFKQFDDQFHSIIKDFNSTLPLKLFTKQNLSLDSQIQNENLDFQTKAYTNSIVKKFDPLIKTLSTQIFTKQDNLSKKLSDIQTGLVEKQKEIDDIKLQLNKIQFPLGSIPLELNSTIAAFPLALAIFFVIYVVIYKKAIILRNKFQETYDKIDRKNTVFNDQNITLIAPLWLDPVSQKNIKKKDYMKFIGKLLIFVIPSIFFLIQIIIVVYGFYVYGDPYQSNQAFEKIFEYPYSILYFGFCIGLFFYGFITIGIQLRNN